MTNETVAREKTAAPSNLISLEDRRPKAPPAQDSMVLYKVRADALFWALIVYTKIRPNPTLAKEAYGYLEQVLHLPLSEAYVSTSPEFHQKITEEVDPAETYSHLLDLQ
jgi:hypothetical protein